MLSNVLPKRKSTLDRVKERVPVVKIGAGAAVAAGAVALLAKYRRQAAGKAQGLAQEAKRSAPGVGADVDDTTLTHQVESELLGPPGAPDKGKVVVNVQNGIVELRGEVKRPDQVNELEAKAGKVRGVREVHNLLHTPGSPPKHSPPSDPDEVKERAKAS